MQGGDEACGAPAEASEGVQSEEREGELDGATMGPAR